MTRDTDPAPQTPSGGRALDAADLARLQALQVQIIPRLRPGAVLAGGAAFEPGSRHRAQGLMPLGAYSYCRGVFGPCDRIGRYCSIAQGVTVMGDDHPHMFASTSPALYHAGEHRRMTGRPPPAGLPDFDGSPAPVTIGDDVWIGQDVLLRGGIRIGTGAVIAARAVVTGDVPDYAIVGGVPARVIRMRFDDALVAALTASRWWDYDATVLAPLDIAHPAVFARAVADLRASGQPVRPENRRTLAAHLGWTADPA